MRRYAARRGGRGCPKVRAECFRGGEECLPHDLNRVYIALEEAKAREQEAVADCQHALKLFKFKKYKEGYEDKKRGVPPKYLLDIGSFLKGEG